MNRRLVSWLSLAAVACSPGSPSEDDRRALPADSVSAPVDASAASPGTAADPSARAPVVVFLGTSLTAGLGLLRAEDTYVSRLGELADSAGLPIREVNAGLSGETSAGGLRRLGWVLRGPVDVLVVELGANDGLRGQDPAATADNLREIVTRTRATHPGVQVVIAGMEAPTNLGEDYTRRFREVFPAVAAETRSALIPFILDGVAGVAELNQGDGIHPTAEGHRRMARNAWAILEPVVRGWYGEQGRGAREPGP